MSEFETIYERVVHPAFRWFTQKARTHGLEAGHSLSKWRADGQRIGVVWFKIQSATYRLNVVARSDREQIEIFSPVLERKGMLQAPARPKLAENREGMERLLRTFLVAALEAERESGV